MTPQVKVKQLPKQQGSLYTPGPDMVILARKGESYGAEQLQMG